MTYPDGPLSDWDEQTEKLKDPYAHLPLMQRPDFVYREHKHVRARCVRVGDIILEKRHGREEERWTVTAVEVGDVLVYVSCAGRKGKIALGLPTERIWIARKE